jgi:hypothetical protein
MNSEWEQALLITAIGISLVFSTLILLWGVMAALTRILGVKPVPPLEQNRQNEKIAAIMVALDLYQTEMRREAAPLVREHRPGSLPSRWVAIGRGRQTEHPTRH